MVLLVVGGSALAGGKDSAPGHEEKADKGAVETEEVVYEESEVDDSADSTDSSLELEIEETDEGSASTQEFRSTSDSSTSSRDSDGSGTVISNPQKPNQKAKPYEPDPEPVETDPATTGPSTCPDYDDGDADPYDHENCDGTQGLHGNGGNGKCAGCTGKADDKLPGGQFAGDHNNGYECDHNGGVGKGNPAHSKCPPPPPTCPDGRPMPSNGVCDEPVRRPPLPDVIKRPSVPPPRVLPRVPFARPPEVPKFKPREKVSGVLPVTGPSELLRFVWVAMSLIAAGIAALMSTRRRKELGARDW